MIGGDRKSPDLMADNTAADREPLRGSVSGAIHAGIAFSHADHFGATFVALAR
jgi:hypothetical protein